MAQITKIKHTNTDYGKCILISFRHIWNGKKAKPCYSIDSFADFYPDTNCLTIFNHNESKPYYFDSFKSALKYILSL